jgi:hypothetical protein
MNAATVVWVSPASPKRRVTGATGAPASMAAWKTAERKRPPVRPHQVVPSGNTATMPPARNTAVTPATVRGRARGRNRSTNTVPAAAASAPITGHDRTSRLASSRAGAYASSTSTSSHETWLATISAPCRGNRPRNSCRTPSAASSPRANNRITRPRPAAPTSAMTGRVAVAAAITATAATVRAATRIGLTRGVESDEGRQKVSQAERGSHSESVTIYSPSLWSPRKCRV